MNTSLFGTFLSTAASGGKEFVGGMTLRDWFAGLAMQGIITDPNGPSNETLAKWAYRVADTMIEERNKCSNS
jgi:hypothetical protein